MARYYSMRVVDGVQDDEFEGLTKRQKKKLIRIMARISEASYRRGFQHGGIITGKRLTVDPYNFRYRTSLDKSPWPDGRLAHTAIERLFIEFEELSNVGFMDFYPGLERNKKQAKA